MASSILMTILTILAGCQTSSTSPTPGPLPDLYIIIEFINNSGINANRIHVAVTGQNSAGVQGYFDLTKDPIEYTSSSSIPDITLDTLLAHGSMTVPYIVSGRIYFAVDRQVSAEVADFNQQNVSDGVIYDKVELTVRDTGNVINLTQVDYFAMPIKISSGGNVRGFNDGITRNQIFSEYASTVSGDFAKLILKDSSGNNLRILNPAKVIPTDTANFSEIISYFDPIINEYWASGKSVSLLRSDTSEVITGAADGSKVDFGSNGAYFKPSSIDMFGQAVNSGDNADIVKWLACAINRGVIKNPSVNDQGDSSKFYGASSAYNNGIYNKYSEFFHNDKYTVNGRAYALAFDDVFGEDSALGVANKGTVSITLQAFE